MTNSVYAMLSKQAGLMKELNSVANNIANASTAGYRREGYLFSEYVQRLGQDDYSLSQTNVAGRFYFRRSRLPPVRQRSSAFLLP